MKYSCLPTSKINNGKYSLKTVQPCHIESIRQWRNAQLSVLRQQYPISFNQQTTYFEKIVWPEMNKDKPDNILMIYQINTRIIGYGGLVHIAWDHLRAEVSFLLDPKHTTNQNVYENYFSNFLYLIKILAFDNLNFVKIYTETFSTREYHIKILEHNGFIREGVLRKHVIINGKSIDSLIHGYVNPIC